MLSFELGRVEKCSVDVGLRKGSYAVGMRAAQTEWKRSGAILVDTLGKLSSCQWIVKDMRSSLDVKSNYFQIAEEVLVVVCSSSSNRRKWRGVRSYLV